jgi:hypothetical protein
MLPITKLIILYSYQDYNKPLAYIEDWMRKSDDVSQEVIKDWDKFFEVYADVKPSQVQFMHCW